VAEPEVGLTGHEPGALELCQGLGRGVLAHSGECGHVPQRHVVLAEHRQRARNRSAGARQPLEPQQHRGAHRVRAERGHSLRVRLGRLDALRADLVHQLLEQEGVAARRVVACGREGGVARAQQRLDAPARALRRERAGPDAGRRGVGEDLRERHRELADLRRPDRQQQHHGQVRDPQAQKALGRHRRLVRPLGVVDRDEERLLAGEVRDQPVQPVQALVHQLGVLGLLAAGLEDRERQLRGSGEQPGALLLGLLELDRVGRLAHDAVRIAPLELRCAHRQRVHAALAREVHAGGHEPRLPDAGRALDRHDAPAAADRGLERGVERGELRGALEQAGILGIEQRWVVRRLRIHCLCKHPPSGAT
jgi:hypothetical protein